MNIKRYEPIEVVGPDGDDVAMEERPDGQWYHRADLIAAGCLVPEPDGEVKSFLFACEDQCEYVKWNGKVCRIDSLQEGVDVVGENKNYPLANAISVQPVRLVPLEDVG